MQPNRGGRDPFSDFGNPSAGFGGIGGFGGFGGFGVGFGDHRSITSSFFGGRDPFDDPFFTRPFGGMFESSFFGSGPFGESPVVCMQPQPSRFIEHQALEPKTSRGPIIEEINSDEENEDANKEKKENQRKHGRSNNKPYVEDPEDEVQEKKGKYLQHGNNSLMNMQAQPQGHSLTLHSSTVTYGGSNGAYYTSSRTRRSGSDGIIIDESKEADTTTRQATHRISRGLHNKGHSVTRKLNSDGKVNSMQTLHNLNEDELTGFEEAWKTNAGRHLPGWIENFNGYNSFAESNGPNVQSRGGGWALPSSQHSQGTGRLISQNSRQTPGPSHSQHMSRTKADHAESSYSRGRG